MFLNNVRIIYITCPFIKTAYAILFKYSLTRHWHWSAGEVGDSAVAPLRTTCCVYTQLGRDPGWTDQSRTNVRPTAWARSPIQFYVKVSRTWLIKVRVVLVRSYPKTRNVTNWLRGNIFPLSVYVIKINMHSSKTIYTTEKNVVHALF